jgi:F-type H+-transporting ATPase subunit alpha
MQLNPSEISELIKSKIENLAISADLRTQGTVVSVTDGICRVYGLTDAMQGEMLEFPGNTFGMALNLDRDSVGAVVLGEYDQISEGDTVKTTGRILEVPVGPELLGRVVNSLGQPIDGKGPVNNKLTRQDRESRAGRHLAQIGFATGTDRPEVDRCDGTRRSWPARVDHW